jgi:hypothetical protein
LHEAAKSGDWLGVNALAIAGFRGWDRLAPRAAPRYPVRMTEKLEALRVRLLAAQRELITAAANAGAIPSDNAMRKIADLEVTIGAIEAMIDDQRKA